MLGVLVVQLLPILPSPVAPGLVCLVLLAAAWRRPLSIAIVLPLAFLSAGVGWASFQGQRLLDQQLPLTIERKNLVLTGVVDGLPQRSAERIRFDFRVNRAEYQGNRVEVPSKIRLSAYRTEWAPKPGQRWQLVARLRRPHGFQNPGGFDYESYLFSWRIRATGYVVEKQPRIYLGQLEWTGTLDRLRQTLSLSIERALGSDSQVGILTALAIGDRQRIDARQWEILQRTGTSHLVAISGLHLSLISGLVFLLTQWSWKRFEYGCLRFPARKAASIAALAFAGGYAALAGFSIPTQRALVMLAAGYITILLSRQPIRLRVIAGAMLCVLLYDPLAVLSPGFWLSFAAVGIIFYVTIGRTGNGRLIDGLRIQWAISLGLIPVTLLFFQTASVVSPIANLLAIPVYALLVVPLTLFAVLTSPFTALSQALLQVASWFSALGWSWISWLDQHSPVVLQLPTPGILAMTCSLVGLAIIGLPSGVPARWLGLFWCLPLLWVPARPAPGTFRVTLLDVGQGLSAVIQTRNHVLLFDTGARFSDDFDAGDAVVVPFLRARGITALDAVIISHGDNDHIGGYRSVSDNSNVRRLISNAESLQPAEPCLAGRNWQWDGIDFSILHPEKAEGAQNNNGSCVLRISAEPGSALLTADIERQTERLLVKQYAGGLRSDLLIAPHHGSQTSSSNIFIEAVQPQWILIPAGYLNRYRHPAKRVVQRYDAGNIPWSVTGTSGAIDVTFDHAPFKPLMYRNQYRRYWHNHFSTESAADQVGAGES